ncbi:MAG: DNA polymerase III subunit gamma/tau [Syntrophobacteraceae bacterium]
MSYVVIARKWRPQTFDEVIGQPHVSKTLQNAIRSKRVAHAYLFTGSRGVGKTSVARILAKALNCEHGISPIPCNACSNCKEITQGNSPDVIEVDGASNRGIDNIRELRETVRYRPAKSAYKIYIIDEVHMLTTEAFNALLKTLEEPPDHVLFVFATTEPHKIPSTILSRCQRFDFRRIPTLQIVAQLKEIVNLETVDLSEAVLYALAREADGSMRDAQSLLEQLLAFAGDDLTDEEILDVLGVVDRRSVHRAAEAVLAGDTGSCLNVVGDLYRRGIDSRRFCQHLCDHFRNMLFVALGRSDGGSRPELPEEEWKLLQNQVDKTSPDSLYLYFQTVIKGEEEIRRSTMPRISLEMLLLRLAQLPRLETLESVLEKLSAIESRLADEPGCVLSEPAPSLDRSRRAIPDHDSSRDAERKSTPQSLAAIGRETMPGQSEGLAPAPEPEGHAPTSPIRLSSHAEIQGLWPTFLQWLPGKDPILAAKLSHSRITTSSETVLSMEVLDVYEDTFKETPALARLTDKVEAYFGRRFQWNVFSRSSLKPEAEDSHKPNRPKVNPRRLVMEHPIVQQAIEILGGELTDIRLVKSGGTDRQPPVSNVLMEESSESA